jgi:hypothetical protein
MDTAALYQQYISELDRALNPVPSSIEFSDTPQVFLAEGVVPVAFVNDAFVIYRACVVEMEPSHVWLQSVATVWVKVQATQEATAHANHHITTDNLILSNEELTALLTNFPDIDLSPVLNLRPQLIAQAGQDALFFLTTYHRAGASEETNVMRAKWRCARVVEAEVIAGLAAGIRKLRCESDALRFLRLCQTKTYQKAEANV